MSAGSARAFHRAIRAGVTAVLFLSLFAVSDVDAQGRRAGHVLHHDSSNPLPGHHRGKGYFKTPSKAVFSASGSIISPSVQFAAASAVIGVRGMLRDQSLRRADGTSISAEVQGSIMDLLDGGSDGAILSLISTLEGPDNEVAAAEAARLVTLLAGLVDEPETFPATALAYNEFVDRSSDAFVLNPPEELLAIRAVLFTVLEPTLRAVEDDDDDDDDEFQGQPTGF